MKTIIGILVFLGIVLALSDKKGPAQRTNTVSYSATFQDSGYDSARAASATAAYLENRAMYTRFQNESRAQEAAARAQWRQRQAEVYRNAYR